MTSSQTVGAVRRGGPHALVFAAALFGTAVAEAEGCRSAVGSKQAERLVERCIAVSPATRPPCNADNDCALIESEIARDCRMVGGGDPPAFCRDY